MELNCLSREQKEDILRNNGKSAQMISALTLDRVARCSITKARANYLNLPHASVKTPVFMPVGTQGAMKGVTAPQLEEIGCNMILGNTYHLVIFA